MKPPGNVLVLSVDKKTQIQALDRTQPSLPLNPSRIGSRTLDDRRHGTAALYAVFDTLTGKVADKTNGEALLFFLKLLNRRVSADKDLHIMLDNLSAHKAPAACEWLDAHPRIHLHFTPTSSSWLNAVVGRFAQLERPALYCGVFASVPELKAEQQRFISAHNAHNAQPFKWTKPTGNFIATVGRAKHALHN